MFTFRFYSRPALSIIKQARCNALRPVDRSSSSLLALVAMAASIAVAGCGGVVANKAVSASAGSFTVSPTTLAFGNVTVGVPATSKIALANTTSSAIVISSLAVTGGAFSVDGAGSLPATIAAGSTLNLNVHFNPTAASSATGQLVIASNSLVNPSVTVQMSGTGVAATSALTANATTLAFGNVNVGSPATQSLTLSSTGSTSVTVSSATVSGTGFSVSGATFPLTLNSGQTATLSVQFNPTTTGAATGQLTIASNSVTNAQLQIPLTGTGQAAPATSYQVSLSWSAPSSSSDPVSGYNVYRATGTSSSFQKLNSSVNAPVTFTDQSVTSSTSYQYYVTSVDASGAESAPSNTATVAVP
jgi:hypothetical protein